MEYEAREKAIRDYNAAISYAQKQGIEIGENRTIKILTMHINGSTNGELAEVCNLSMEEVGRLIQSVFN